MNISPTRHAILLAGAMVIGCSTASQKPTAPVAGPMPALAPSAKPESFSPATKPMSSVAAVEGEQKLINKLVPLQFNEKSITAIKAGTKTATIRSGSRHFQAEPVPAVGSAGSAITLDEVKTTEKKMSELTDADAKANGSASLDELKADLSKNYPDLEPDDKVTVITFKYMAK